MRARLAARQKDLKPAIALWREILEREPLALDAHHALTQLLDESEGDLVATKYLEQVCAANPKHFGLHYQLLWRVNSDGPRAAEPILERLVEQNPASASLRSERARWHGRLGRWTEAMGEAKLAIELDPNSPTGHATKGWILKSQSQLAEAAESYRRALTVSVDFEPETMQGLLSSTSTAMERRMAVNFLQTELSRHLIYGSGLLAFRELAARHVHPDDVLKILHKMLTDRPDLWHAWAALIRELTDQRLFDEALEIAERGLAQLPLCADLWNEAAVLHNARKDAKKELAAREKVFELCPGNVSVMRQLASTLQRADERERAKTLLEEALRIQPRDAATLYMLGLSHWKAEEKEKAIACVKEAVSFSPDFGPAWESLQSWGHATKQPRIALEMAQTLTGQRKEDPAAWLRLARFHWGEENVTEALRVVEQAITLRETSLNAQVLKVQILTDEERFAEAYQVCNLPIWGTIPPAELRATEACILEAEGRHDEAIAKMEATLTDAPHLAWAWQRLADWHLAGKQHDEAKEIIERLSMALPNNPAPLLRAAAARHHVGDYPEASELLERALLMHPGSIEARTRLMVIQVQTNQFNALRETITILRQHGVDDWALSAEGCVALKQQDTGFASVRLTELCSMPGVDYGAVDMLSGAFFNFGLGPLMRKPLQKALEAPEPFAGTGALLVAANRAKGRLISLGKLFKLQKHRRVGQRATIEYLHSLGYFASNAESWRGRVTHLASRWKLLRLKLRLGKWIKSDAGGWVAFGAALAANGQNRAARRWLKEWRTRKKLRARYYSLFELLSDVGLDADAQTIGQEALRQTGGRDLLRMQLRVAWLEANFGDTKAAKKLIEELERESSLAPLFVVIRWVVRMREAKDDARSREAKEGFDSIRLSLTREYLRNSPEYVRQYTRQSLGLLAKTGAGPKARVWAKRMCSSGRLS
jgi:tetratricopeptide (TPR) repeat protein